MSTDNRSEILLLDPDAGRSESLCQIITRNFSCRHVATLADSSNLDFSAAIVVSDDPDDETYAALSGLTQRLSSDRVAVLSTKPINSHLEQLFSAGVKHLLCGAGPWLERDLAWQLRAMLTQDRFLPLEQLFGRFSEARVFLVRDRWERQEALDRTVEFFADAEFPDSVLDLRLALDEMLNNALYHSFRDTAGDEKYSSETFDSLLFGETVTIQIARDAEFNVVCVSDNAGTLDANSVTDHLVRHMNMKGLMDEHGRGFFLMRSVSDAVMIRIQIGVRTAVTLVFGRHSSLPVKSLLIQSIGER